MGRAGKRLRVWEAFGRHLGCIWEASGRDLGRAGKRLRVWEAFGRTRLGGLGIGRTHLGGIWEASGRDWGLGVRI